MPNPLWANVKLFSIKTAGFPWGLLNEVISVCQDWQSCRPNDSFKVVTTRKIKPEKIAFNKKLYPYQCDAVTALVNNHGGILSLPCGAGKTFTAIEFIKQYKEKTLVIVPTRDLVTQWNEQVPDYVDVKTYQSVGNDYSILGQYKIICIDEVHIGSIGTIYKICMKLKEQILFCLSATAYRIDGETMKMIGACGKIVYKKSLRELIDEGYLCDAQIDKIQLTKHQPEFYMSYQEIYDDYIVNNEERNKEIIDTCLYEYHDKKMIVLVDRIEHGKMLLEKMGDEATFWNSKTKDRDDRFRIIIGTSLLDQGLNLPDREVVVLGGGGKSSIKVMQRIGRVLRKHPGKEIATIVEFVDDAKYLSKHHKERMEVYNEHGFKEKN